MYVPHNEYGEANPRDDRHEEEFLIDPAFCIRDEQSLRSLFPATHDLAIQKFQTALGERAQEFIRRSPFLCLGTQDLGGRADVSPRGDPPGFVRILDPQTLAIPDRPGNNRLDSLSNIIANPNVGLLFMIPGFDETLRVNGTARISAAPALCERFAVDDKAPASVLVIHVTSVFFQCARAIKRSHLWDTARHIERHALPSPGLILETLSRSGIDGDAYDAALQARQAATLY